MDTEGIQNLSQLANLANMLGNFGPNLNINFTSNIGAQPQFVQQTSQGGTFFSQQPQYANMPHQHQVYYDSHDDYQEEGDLLGEYPDDEFQDDENEEQVDSDGEPLPTADQVRDIINSIPSYSFQEK